MSTKRTILTIMWSGYLVIVMVFIYAFAIAESAESEKNELKTNEKTLIGTWDLMRLGAFLLIGNDQRLPIGLQTHNSLTFTQDSIFISPGLFAWRKDTMPDGVYPWVYKGRGVPVSYLGDTDNIIAWDPRLQDWIPYRVQWIQKDWMRLIDNNGTKLDLRRSKKNSTVTPLKSKNVDIDSIHIQVANVGLNVLYRLRLLRTGEVLYWRPDSELEGNSYVVCNALFSKGEFARVEQDISLLRLDALSYCYAQRKVPIGIEYPTVDIMLYYSNGIEQSHRFNFDCAQKVLVYLYPIIFAHDIAANIECSRQGELPGWRW